MNYFSRSLEHRLPGASNPGRPWHRLLPKGIKENQFIKYKDLKKNFKINDNLI